LRHLDIRVSGRVQGVFYRASTEEAARRIGVTGTVRNEPDGSVRVEAEGTAAQLDRFLAWLNHGPPAARVESVEARDGDVVGFERFETVY
jgi:acylphosphatase